MSITKDTANLITPDTPDTPDKPQFPSYPIMKNDSDYPSAPPPYELSNPVALPQTNQFPVAQPQMNPFPVAQPQMNPFPVAQPQPPPQQQAFSMNANVNVGFVPLPPGTCSFCRKGKIKNSASCCTWLWCILLLPFGIIPGLCVFCCCCRKPKCNNCGFTC